MNGKLRRIALVGASVALVAAAGMQPATAHGRSDGRDWRGSEIDKGWGHQGHHRTWQVGDTVVDGLLAPLLGLSARGNKLVVAQSFAGMLTSVNRDGTTQNIVNETHATTGLDIGRRGSIAYTVGPGSPTDPPFAQVKLLKRDGTTTVLADTLAYEQANNPDQVNSYGFQGLSPGCAATVPAEIGGGNSYNGMVDSHAYAVTFAGRGGYFVADAGGNTILRISRNGTVSTVAVLPPQPLRVTADLAKGMGLDSCTVDHDFNFEPVPTDVEIGPDGWLYVTTLPGGPEDASLGARGSVYKVNPWTGWTKQVATGFLGAVNLAFDDNGRIYVAEMFGNAVSKVVNGRAHKIADVPTPGAIDFARGKLFVTTSGDFGTPTAKVITLTS